MRKKEGDKKADIISAAIKFFAKMGFHDTKIHHIADNAGIATGTVYLYFGNKEKILLNIFETVWKHIFENLEQISQNQTLETLIKFDQMVDSLFNYFTSDPLLARVFVNEQNRLVQKKKELFTVYYLKSIRLIEDLVKEGIDRKTFDPSIEPLTCSHFIFGGLRHILLQWSDDQSRYSLDTIRLNIKNYIRYGLTGPKDKTPGIQSV